MNSKLLPLTRRVSSRAQIISKSYQFQTETQVWVAAITALCICYFIQFELVRTQSALASLRSTLVNVAPMGLLAVSVRLLVRRVLVKRSWLQQFIAHIILAVVFAHAWYVLLRVAGSFRLDWISSGMHLSPFYESATTWQLLQGVVIYSALLGVIYGCWLHDRIEDLQLKLDMAEAVTSSEETTSGTADSPTIFVKHSGEYRRIDALDVFHIQADGDYVRLQTRQGEFQSNKPLASFAKKLEGRGFIRIHRSHLVRASQIISAEPTGDGRLSIHLSNGTTVIASRSGSKAFRDHVA